MTSSRESRSELVAQLRGAAICVHIGMDPSSAASISRLLTQAADALTRSETASINAAQIIGWARTVRNASPGSKWTDTEINLADAIMEVAGGK